MGENGCCGGGMHHGHGIALNVKAPNFRAMALKDNEFKEVMLSDFQGKFVVLFFYPADFTFVCPTELEDMAENYAKFKEMGVEVLSISTDTHWVHKAWHDTSKSIKKITFPMVADPTHAISKVYNVLRHGEGVADRATIVVDPEGMIKGIEITDEPVGRNVDELIRKIGALEYARSHPGQACPAKWEPGKETLKPGIDLVGKI